MLSRCFLDFSVGVGAFVIGLSQISSFFYDFKKCLILLISKAHRLFSEKNLLQNPVIL